MKKFTKGFTLIELLVVIAIIGILASVVLASLNTARDKASDAAVKSNLNNVRAQAELYYDGNGLSYANACSNANISAARTAADNANGAGKVATCVSGQTGWAMEAQVKTSTDFYCVDSTGQSATSSASTIGTGTSPNVDCGCGSVTNVCGA